jgi:hypothetical protein
MNLPDDIYSLMIDKKVYLWGYMKYSVLKKFIYCYMDINSEYTYRKSIESLVNDKILKKKKLKKNYYYVFNYHNYKKLKEDYSKVDF